MEEQLMSSSSSLSDLEQRMAAALHRQTRVAAGGVAPDLAAAAAAAALRRGMAALGAMETGALSANVASARSLVDQIFSHQDQLRRRKDELRSLQSQLSETLKIQSRKELKCKRVTESISETTTTIEQLRSSLADLRVKRDLRAKSIPEELQALKSLEAESNEDAENDEKLSKLLLWYDKFLGFRVIGEEGVKFVFNKIDPQRPEKEYWFRVSAGLEFIECHPHVKDIEKLAKDLDLNEHLYNFVRMGREKFQSSLMNGTLPRSPVLGPDVSAAPLPSPMVMSVNNRSEDARNQTESRRKNQLLPAKRQASVSPRVQRRSPRLHS